jgi:pyridoxine/pyridoxamine 5'-phosphate oxidase
VDKAFLQAFIQRSRYGVLASLSPDGTPQSALLGIACTPALQIVFDTLQNTRKYRNLTQHPQCSMVIGWSGEQTLQLEGYAEELSGALLLSLQDLYFQQWPECRTHLAWPGITYVAITPTWLRFSDYNQSPPAITEVSLV